MRHCLLFITLSLSMISIITTIEAHGTKQSKHSNAPSKKVFIKGKRARGISIGKDKVTLKPGYVFKQVSSHQVNVLSSVKDNNNIAGSVDCKCNGNEGSCSALVKQKQVSCVSSGCKHCYMVVTVPSSLI